MSGERIDYSIERQRHEGFIGRAALLARLDQLLVADRTDRWVVVTGGPGMGKSAMLAAWLARREATGAVVAHHFIRRGEYDWDDPGKLVSSLVAQLEERFPGQREPDADAQKHPAARLVATLTRVSLKELVPRGERLTVLIDGLDEYDPPARPPTGDPLAAFLPHALPRGVSFLCASRPRHPYVAMLEARDGELVRIDLDDPDAAADNNATVRGFWEQAAPPLGLDPRFIDEAVARADGNLQHAATLRKRLAGLPAAQRRVEDIPRGLAALLVKLWERIATEPLAVHGLGILCAAREALTLDELGAVAGWAGEANRHGFVRGARELLVETRRASEHAEYRLHHESIRAHIASTLGAAVLRGHHAALARQLATWPPPADTTTRRYALRHALTHRTEAGEWADAWQLAGDMGFLEAKCRELSVHEAEADVARAAERCCANGDEAIGRRFDDLARALVRESHWLRDTPAATAGLLWNRLRRTGWSMEKLDEQLRIPARATFLRVRHGVTRESPALVRDLVGHVGWAIACAVTPDGRRVVSASNDQTLKVWDLDSGRLLGTFKGHTNPVTACAVTPDGQRVVSTSHDHTLKVWDLDSGRLLATFEGHASAVTACAVTPDGRRVVSASRDHTLKVWDLDSGRVLATFEGHASAVTACAVTPDGQRVVSVSKDNTLKVWDLDTYVCLLTHRGDASFTAVAATATAVVAGDVTGTVWFLDWPASMAPPIRPVLSPVPAGSATSARATTPPKPTMNRHVILFLAANPSGTTRLALDEECAAIERELRMTTGRDDLDFRSKWAVSVDEMMRHMNELQPTVIHFSGHAGGHAGIYVQGEPRRSAPVHRDIEAAAGAGIQLQDDQRQPQHVTARALTQMIGTAAPSARVVVLNACFSDAVAEALRGVADCVVGMRGAIGDVAARSFAVGFYRALGYRRSVGNAVAQAVAALAAKQFPDEHLPVCRTRDGVNADQVLLPSLDPHR